MKALSIRQPWAWAILHAGKDVENRDWSERNPARWQAHNLAGERSRIAIHAGKTFDQQGYDFLRLKLGASIPWRKDFDLGGFVGSVRLVGVVNAHPSSWFFGPLGLLLDEPKPIALAPSRGAAEANPRAFVRAKGMLGFFDVPEALIAALGAEK